MERARGCGISRWPAAAKLRAGAAGASVRVIPADRSCEAHPVVAAGVVVAVNRTVDRHADVRAHVEAGQDLLRRADRVGEGPIESGQPHRVPAQRRAPFVEQRLQCARPGEQLGAVAAHLRECGRALQGTEPAR